MTSRKSVGSAAYTGSWPDDKDEMMLLYSRVSGVKKQGDGTGKTIVLDALKEEYPVSDVEDVSTIIFYTTGYKPSLSFLEDKLRP